MDAKSAELIRPNAQLRAVRTTDPVGFVNSVMLICRGNPADATRPFATRNGGKSIETDESAT